MKDRGEICFNAMIFLGSIYLFQASRSFPRFQAADELGPAIWPQCLLAATIVLSGVLLARNAVDLLKSRTGPRPAGPTSKKPAVGSLLLVMLLTLVYAVALDYLGFLLSIIIFQVILLYILRVRNAVTLIVFPLGLTAAFYLIFVKLLDLLFPRGEGIFLHFSRLFY